LIYTSVGDIDNILCITLALIVTLQKSVYFRSTYTYRWRSAAAIQERVTEVLRSIPKEAFTDSFQELYERCQPCVVKGGDYFEGQ
jgi:hypothetical protein